MSHLLAKIDETNLGIRQWLDCDDDCFYFSDYTAGAGYNESKTNSLISNLKKLPSTKGQPQWHYKEKAIGEAAAQLKASFSHSALKAYTIVPIPPSKAKGDPEYDDRLSWILRVFDPQNECDIRELLVQSSSTAAAHTLVNPKNRLSPSQLEKILKIDSSLSKPTPKKILLFDDVLTHGAHFKAAKNVLQNHFCPNRIVGLFLARCVW